MQTRNLECQLAMAQLKRYLSGAKLSDEAMEALESHIIECPACQLAVQAQRAQNEKAAPVSPLTQAVVQTPAPTAQSGKPVLGGHLKTLGLSLGLATILIAMSMIANDPTKLFGDRLQSTSKPKPTENPRPKPATQPKPAEAPKPVVASAEVTRVEEELEDKPNSPQKPATVAAKQELASKPETKAPERPRRLAPRSKPTRPKPTPQRVAQPDSGIKVYDQNGTPL